MSASHVWPWSLLLPAVALVHTAAGWLMLAQPRRAAQLVGVLNAGIGAWLWTHELWPMPWLVAGLVVVALVAKPRHQLLVMRVCVSVMMGLIVGVALAVALQQLV